MTRTEIYLDEVCRKIKYRSIHKTVRSELKLHIEESTEELERFTSEQNAEIQAIHYIGSADDVAHAYNRYHKMPFGSRYGLIIWAALVTAVFYVSAPVFKILINQPKNAPAMILGLLFLFGALNYMFLRRAHMIMSGRDVRDILLGFLAGAGASLGMLYAASYTDGCFGFYPYYTNMKILFMNSVEFFGQPLRAPGDELLIIFYEVIIYMISVKINNTKSQFFAVWNFQSGIIIPDLDSFINKKTRMIFFDPFCEKFLKGKYKTEEKGDN